MRAVSLLLRVLGNGMRHIGTLAERLYDLPLFVPLWVESRVAANQASHDREVASIKELASMRPVIEEPQAWQEAQS
jgi:hypothetical protein